MMVAFGLGLLVSMGLMLARLLAGPTLYDRILAVNAFGTKTVLFLAVFAFIIGRPDAIDIAILYAGVNFIATIAILKFFRFRSFELSLARMGEEAAVGQPDAAAEASQAPKSRGGARS
ncbi:MAG: monovalent cation/H+ antiporter complex subunit F [Maricaulaceae bacterium]|jgi:multicomponent Na+:H+ antiporter subunit F